MKHAYLSLLALSAVATPVTAWGQDCRQMGGTANITAVAEGQWVVAMTGDFDGGAYARVVASPKKDGEWIEYALEHYFTNDSGDWIKTRDIGRHRIVEGQRYYGQTTYNVISAGGDFKDYKGSFMSWGAFDYSDGRGVLRFEGQICK